MGIFLWPYIPTISYINILFFNKLENSRASVQSKQTYKLVIIVLIFYVYFPRSCMELDFIKVKPMIKPQPQIYFYWNDQISAFMLV